MADLHAAVLNALSAMPRPITRDDVLAKASEVLAPAGLEQQFRKWFEINGDVLLRRLNG